MPLSRFIFYNLFESLETLASAVNTLVDNCIVGITANEEHCRKQVENSIGVITAICPYVDMRQLPILQKKRCAPADRSVI